MCGCPGVESLQTVAGPDTGVGWLDMMSRPRGRAGRQYDGCTLPHSAPGTTGHDGGVITIQVSSLDIWISLTNDMSYRGSTIPTMPNSGHQPPATQGAVWWWWVLQAAGWPLLFPRKTAGEYDSEGCYQARTHSPRVQVVRGTQWRLTAQLHILYCRRLVRFPWHELTSGCLKIITVFFLCFYGVLVLSATLLVRSVSALVTRVRTAAVQTRWCLTYIVHTRHLSRCLTLS